jgi:hypothetical protein
MTTWRHVVTRELVDGVHVYAVREVYFDDAGAVVRWTQNAVAPNEDSQEDLIVTIERMCEAVNSGDVFDIDTRQWFENYPHQGQR